MKRAYVGWILLVLFAIFGMSATCITFPDGYEGTVPPGTQASTARTPARATGPAPSQEEMTAYNAEVHRAAIARNMIIEFEGYALLPSEWQAAENLFNQASDQSDISTSQSTRDSTSRYARSADAFENLERATLTRYYENMEAELLRARNAAIAAGAMQYAPDLLAQSDFVLNSAGWKYGYGDYSGAQDDARTALAMYNALTVWLGAYTARQEVVHLAEDLAPEVFFRADIVFASSMNSWNAGNYAAAQDNARFAHSMYYAIGVGIDAYISREY